MQLTVVVPVYNEEANIEPLAKALIDVLDGSHSFQILFVDDGSTDVSLAMLRNLAIGDNRLAFLSLSRNFGHQAALRAGLEAARGECVITMDGDFQHPPALLPSMIKEFEKGFDVVNTRRLETSLGEGKRTPFGKRLSARVFYSLMNRLGEVKIEPGSADFRLLSRRAVDALLSMDERALFFRGAVPWIGFSSVELHYSPGERKSGRSKYSLSKMLALAMDGITSFSTRPLRLASLAGFAISGAGFIYALYALLIRLFSDRAVEGWTSILISILIIGGIQLIFMGILGEYLGKLFMEAKHRPHYLIKESSFKAHTDAQGGKP